MRRRTISSTMYVAPQDERSYSMSLTVRTPEHQPLVPTLRWRRLSAVLTATAATAGAWAIVSPLAGVDLRVGSEPDLQTVQLGAVLTSALVAGLASWVVLAAFERWSARPRRNWLVFVAAGLVISLAGPLTAAAGTASTVGLFVLHVVTAVVLAAGLDRSIIRQ
jgi:hypothetical protein